MSIHWAHRQYLNKKLVLLLYFCIWQQSDKTHQTWASRRGTPGLLGRFWHSWPRPEQQQQPVVASSWLTNKQKKQRDPLWLAGNHTGWDWTLSLQLCLTNVFCHMHATTVSALFPGFFESLFHCSLILFLIFMSLCFFFASVHLLYRKCVYLPVCVCLVIFAVAAYLPLCRCVQWSLRYNLEMQGCVREDFLYSYLQLWLGVCPVRWLSAAHKVGEKRGESIIEIRSRGVTHYEKCAWWHSFGKPQPQQNKGHQCHELLF